MVVCRGVFCIQACVAQCSKLRSSTPRGATMLFAIIPADTALNALLSCLGYCYTDPTDVTEAALDTFSATLRMTPSGQPCFVFFWGVVLVCLESEASWLTEETNQPSQCRSERLYNIHTRMLGEVNPLLLQARTLSSLQQTGKRKKDKANTSALHASFPLLSSHHIPLHSVAACFLDGRASLNAVRGIKVSKIQKTKKEQIQSVLTKVQNVQRKKKRACQSRAKTDSSLHLGRKS